MNLNSDCLSSDDSVFTRSPRARKEASFISFDLLQEGGSVDEEIKSQDKDKSDNGELLVTQDGRIYFLDWLRFIAILLVVFVHSLENAFDATNLTPEKDPVIHEKKEAIQKVLLQLGIPAFFYISGCAATFYDTEQYGIKKFLLLKFLGIIVPFLVAIVVFLMPRLYLAQQFEPFARIDGKEEWNYISFILGTLPGLFWKLSWLWFLPCLFVVFYISYPFMRWAKRRSLNMPIDKEQESQIFVLLAIFSVKSGMLAIYVCSKDNFGMAYLLPAMVVYLCGLAVYFLYMYLIQTHFNGEEKLPKYSFCGKLIGPITCVVMNLFKNQAANQQLYDILMMTVYYLVFFAQGVFDQSYFKSQNKFIKSFVGTIYMPITFLVVLVIASLAIPATSKGQGNIWFYPIYSDYVMRCFYTTGTWTFLYLIIIAGTSILNQKFDSNLYQYTQKFSLYVYLSHYFWIQIVSCLLIRPFVDKHKPPNNTAIAFEISTIVEYAGSLLLCYGSWEIAQSLISKFSDPDYSSPNYEYLEEKIKPKDDQAEQPPEDQEEGNLPESTVMEQQPEENQPLIQKDEQA